MPRQFQSTRRVQWADTDAAGIIHFANYFRYMEEAEHEMWRSLGLCVMLEHDGRTITWPRVSAACEFKQPLRFQDVVEIQLTIERVGERSVTYSAVFCKAGDEVARGRLVMTCCQIKAGQIEAIEIPAFIRALLEVPGSGVRPPA